jgi:hypothetical protein
MERKVGELDRQVVIRFEFLDTPGDEVAPGSDEIGKHFKYERLGHRNLLCEFKSFQSFKPFKTLKGLEIATGFYGCWRAEVKRILGSDPRSSQS